MKWRPEQTKGMFAKKKSGVLNSEMRDMTQNIKHILYFTTHRSITPYTYMYM
jgi:hypothetical protein